MRLRVTLWVALLLTAGVMTERIGKYELKRLLATGGMAEIWVASLSGPAGFNRDLAIKRILPHLARDQHFTGMFLDEASIASRLTHPNIAQIFELGEVDGEYFIAMELVEGLDLAQILDLCEENGQFFPIDVAVKIAIDMLGALDFAHEYAEDGKQLGVVHRDVSPHNVLLSTNGRVKLVDFGVAKAVERHSKTQTGLVKGKLSYMAPEQIEDGDVDRRADVFAAGVVLYELLTNVTPFGRDLTAVSAILNKPPPNPTEARAEIPERLSKILLLALEKDPAQRFQTARGMMEELELFLRSQNSFVASRDIKLWLADLRGLEVPPDFSVETVRPDFSQMESQSAHTPVRVSDTAEHFEGNGLAGAFIMLLLALVVIPAYLFRVEIGLTAPSPEPVVEEGSAAWEAMAYNEEEEVEPAGEDETTNEFVFEQDDEDDEASAFLAASLGGQFPSDLLMWAWTEHVGDEEDQLRFDPGDPAVLAVLEGMSTTANSDEKTVKRKKRVRKKRPKSRKRKKKSTKKSKTKKPTKTAKKKPRKKKKKDKGLDRMDTLPAF